MIAFKQKSIHCFSLKCKLSILIVYNSLFIGKFSGIVHLYCPTLVKAETLSVQKVANSTCTQRFYHRLKLREGPQSQILGNSQVPDKSVGHRNRD